MTLLSDRQRTTLRELCDTLAPSLAAESDDDAELFASGALQLDVPDRIESSLTRHADAPTLRDLRRLLGALEQPAINFAVAGVWSRFSGTDLTRRTHILAAWMNSRWLLARQGLVGLKRLTLFLHYCLPSSDGPNPNWRALNYQVPARNRLPERPRRLDILQLDRATTLTADVLIVGTGAGGGVMAAELSAAGLDVLVVDKGVYRQGRDFVPDELVGNQTLYERQGGLTTADKNILVLAGANVGGGTTINWNTSLRPPPEVIRQWVAAGFRSAGEAIFDQALDAVSSRVGVTTEESPAVGSNRLLELGCERLNYRCSVIPRNVLDCDGCDFCNFGCPRDAKQDTRVTFLQDACDRGARLLAEAEVQRLQLSGGRAVGAELLCRTAGGERVEVTVRAARVVVCAGAIHTPALLVRSGLSNPHLGRHLYLHPTTAAYATFDEPILPWQGPPQTRLCDQFADLDGHGYGVRLEVCPAHPGLAALAYPWSGGRDHKRHMQSLAKSSNIIVLTRDRDAGRVRVGKTGQPILDYQISSYDARHSLRGTQEALRVLRAAGGNALFSPHQQSVVFRGGSDAEFARFLDRVQRAGVRRFDYGLYSAHQLGTCRIGQGPRQGVLAPDGSSYEVKNLFVADGSIFPTSTGVNPMLSIMAAAHVVAQEIKAAGPQA